jgi:hypothetical protein
MWLVYNKGRILGLQRFFSSDKVQRLSEQLRLAMDFL